MDPSAIKCIYKNSFDKGGEIPIVLHTYTNKTNNDNITMKLISTDKFEEPNNNDKRLVRNYCDQELSHQVIPLSIIEHIDLFDPFHNTCTYPFLSRDSITLANIDAIFNFSRHRSGYIIKQDTKDYTFATLDDGPGVFTQYILYRNPNSNGYGITPIDYQIDLRIDQRQFKIIQSGTGDLKKDYKSFIQFVRTTEAIGLDLVVGNYVSDIVDPIGYLVRLITALGIIAIGGTFISKVSDLDDPLMVDLLWITTRCFDKVTLFKPVSTPSYDKIYYVIAENAKVNNIEWISYLEEMYSGSVKSNKKIIRLLDDLPISFVQWVIEYNNFILLYNKYLMSEISEGNNGKTKLYDTYKCKAIWNLPQL